MNTSVPADLCLRRRAILCVSLTLLLGLAWLYFYQGLLQELEALATASPQLAVEKLNFVLVVLCLVTFVSATALAFLLGYSAFSVYRAGQWPPPGWRVITPMAIRTGRQASLVAVFFFFLALVALVYGSVLMSQWEPLPEEEIEAPMEDV